MLYFLYGLFFLSCIILVGTVLLQPGKTDAGALFTSNVSSNSFGPRGTTTILSKITIVAAAMFMLSALFLAMPALTGDISVLSTTGETNTETTQPANTDANNANVNSNVAVDSNTAVMTNTDANANVNSTVTNTNTANTAANTNTATNIANKTTNVANKATNK